MKKRTVPMSVVLTMVVSLGGMSASAGNVAIDTSGAAPFLYGGRSYVPLKSTANFLGAPLRWDAARGQSVITYRGQDLALTQNSLKALLAGRPVTLPSPPVVVRGVTYVPTEALRKFYNVPVEWDRAKSKVKIKGPNGWGTMKASSRPFWHGGPPPWAPAWGRRGYGTPRYPGNMKSSGNGKVKAWGRRGYGTPRYPGNMKSSGNGKAKAWERGEYGAPGHPGNVKSNGSGKARGNKKG